MTDRKTLFENCNSYGVSGVYAITNKETKERYIGSSKDIRKRWKTHLDKREWEKNPGMSLYQAFQKYGVENFTFTIVALATEDCLKEVEQEAIEMLNHEYNSKRASGSISIKPIPKGNMFGTERWNRKEYQKKWQAQTCIYEGKEVRLGTLTARFRKVGIERPYIEAKKYLKNNKKL